MKYSSIHDLPVKHHTEHDGYEYNKGDFVARGEAGMTRVTLYEILPGKSAYPYHYHLKNEETFYIISGTGLLRSPEGERTVSAGDLLFFPATAEGAHKLTNTSETEKLVYLDFGVMFDMDVCLYPDSGKIAVWGKDTNKLFRIGDNVPYFEGE